MPLHIGKMCIEVCAHQFAGEFRADDARAKAQHVHAVVFYALVGGERIVASGGADAAKFVGRHAGAGTGAAYENSSIGRSITQRFGDGARVVRIVDGVGRMSPEIKHLMAEFARFLENTGFQGKPGVVGCNCNLHAVFYDSASSSPALVLRLRNAPRGAMSCLVNRRLRAGALPTDRSAIQRRIEVLFYGTMGGLLDLLTGRDASLPLDRAALELAAIEYPQIDADDFVRLLNSYAAELRERLRDARDGEAFVRKTNQFLFDELGFRGNTADYYDPKNSCLNEVLTARTGIPITLSLVYMEIARRLGRPVAGIGLPGHFIVRYDDGLYSAFIDPFHNGRLLEPEDCFTLAREVSQVEIEPDRRWLAPVSKRDLLLRMLRNLSAAYTSRGHTDKAIEALNLLIEANPVSADEYRQRGILETQAGRLAAAKTDLARYLELAASPEDRERAKAQVHQIQHWIASMN